MVVPEAKSHAIAAFCVCESLILTLMYKGYLTGPELTDALTDAALANRSVDPGLPDARAYSDAAVLIESLAISLSAGTSSWMQMPEDCRE